MLSERAKQLIPKARIFTANQLQSQYSQSVIEVFTNADNNSSYLSDEDLDAIKSEAPQLEENLQCSQILREKASQIVDDARKQVLIKFPKITDEGGELYPPFRAEACWRDFWHFLRTISYGIAGKNDNFTSADGLENMKLLYEELKVPLPAMIVGLENLKVYGLSHFSAEQQQDLGVYFDHLIAKMKQFLSSSDS